ncbi:MAG: hypothetical protein K9L56_13075 [Clostridiales bacterium]|nr:hypothetical protein [Clostridiales bacterium]
MVFNVRLFVIIIIALFFLTNCTISDQNINNAHKKQNQEFMLLDLNQIKSLFKKEGVKLTKNHSININNYQIRGTKPTVFNLEQIGGKLFVFIFQTITDRHSIMEQFKIGPLIDSDNQMYSLFSTQKEINPSIQAAKNAIIVYIPDKSFTMIKRVKNHKLIEEIVFNRLNDTKRLEFSGQSKTWKAIYTVKYYDYTWKANGTLKHETWAKKKGKLKYKGSNIQDVGKFKYQLEKGSGEASGDISLNDNGTTFFATGEGTIAHPNRDQIFTLYIRWNDKKEIIHLKSDPPGV